MYKITIANAAGSIEVLSSRRSVYKAVDDALNNAASSGLDVDDTTYTINVQPQSSVTTGSGW